MFDKNPDMPKPMKWLKIVVIILAIVTVGLGAFLVYGMYFQKEKTQELAKESTTATASTAASQSKQIVDEGVKWQTPEKLEDLELFSGREESDYIGTTYYKVGTTASGASIIMADLIMGGLGETEHIFRFVQSGDSYKLITQNSEEIDDSQYNVDYNKVVSDRTFVFKSLLAETVITEGETQLISSKSFWYREQGDFDKVKVSDTSWGPLYREYVQDISTKSMNEESSDDETILKVARYYIQFNDSTKVTYEPRPSFLLDDNTFNLSYENEQVGGLSFDKIATSGCGIGFGSFPSVAIKISDAQLVGSSGSSKVYSISNSRNKLVKFAYEIYKNDQAEGKISIEEFAKSFPILTWKDAYGDTILYLNSKFTPNTECGKPVVYLYPQNKTSFEVKIGADVTVSEPLYGGSWRGVASSDGTLAVAGQNYKSLFWEGKGWGLYPKIDFGRIVERKSVEKEIRSDLSTIGLVNDEIDDFMEFWLPKMPQTKYVRLSWLTNNQLDELAPLKIKPKPDSVIRAFLDFSGLENRVELKPQTLPSFSREGFAAVEWGGLLKD